jgi:hypothetical protein
MRSKKGFGRVKGILYLSKIMSEGSQFGFLVYETPTLSASLSLLLVIFASKITFTLCSFFICQYGLWSNLLKNSCSLAHFSKVGETKFEMYVYNSRSMRLRVSGCLL